MPNNTEKKSHRHLISLKGPNSGGNSGNKYALFLFQISEESPISCNILSCDSSHCDIPQHWIHVSKYTLISKNHLLIKLFKLLKYLKARSLNREWKEWLISIREKENINKNE
jgi:hypothetical protein